MNCEMVGSFFLTQRRRGAEDAENEFQPPMKNLCALCIFAPLRFTKHRPAALARTRFHSHLPHAR